MKHGFTLVELSIVLVIIGLLIGGILVAQSMVGTSIIQSQIKQIDQFDIAYTNFKNLYKQIPGDCNICNHAGTGVGTGNNNGRLEDVGGTTPPASVWVEPYFFYADLYNMGHFKDRYQWVNNQIDFGKDKQFPAAAIGRGGFAATGNRAGDVYYSTISTGFNNGTSGFPSLMAQGIFSPSEGLALDKKIDDGLPTNGNVQVTSVTAAASGATIPFTAPTDSSTFCVYNAAYNTVLPATNLCRMVVKAAAMSESR